jgi:hypothetical protein
MGAAGQGEVRVRDAHREVRRCSPMNRAAAMVSSPAIQVITPTATCIWVATRPVTTSATPGDEYRTCQQHPSAAETVDGGPGHELRIVVE